MSETRIANEADMHVTLYATYQVFNDAFGNEPLIRFRRKLTLRAQEWPVSAEVNDRCR
jgi:hypothetical protein